MKISLWWLACAVGALTVGCSQMDGDSHRSSAIVAPSAADVGVADDEDDDEDEYEEDIPLSDVPASIQQAAIDAVPGLVLSEAEKELEHGVTVYSLAGTANGHSYEVEVTADGKVTEIEADEEDDD